MVAAVSQTLQGQALGPEVPLVLAEVARAPRQASGISGSECGGHRSLSLEPAAGIWERSWKFSLSSYPHPSVTLHVLTSPERTARCSPESFSLCPWAHTGLGCWTAFSRLPGLCVWSHDSALTNGMWAEMKDFHAWSQPPPPSSHPRAVLHALSSQDGGETQWKTQGPPRRWWSQDK